MPTAPDTTALWSEFHRPLGAFLSRRVRRDADVDDLLQEVFVRIHKRIDSLERFDRVGPWIFQIARNTLVDFQRVRATRSDGTEPVDDAPAAEPDDETGLELAACLRPMVDRLPEPYREAIRLTELEGLTQADAAERAGITPSGMKSRVQRGRERLKTMILECCHVELDARGGVVDYRRCACTSSEEPGS